MLVQVELNEEEYNAWLKLGGRAWLLKRCQPRPVQRRLKTAKRWLQEALAAGPERVTVLWMGALQVGISTATLGRAKRALGVESVPSGGGKAREWYWRLPQIASESDAQRQSVGANGHARD